MKPSLPSDSRTPTVMYHNANRKKSVSGTTIVNSEVKGRMIGMKDRRRLLIICCTLFMGGMLSGYGQAEDQPGEPLFRRRHIFVLLLIGAWNHEAGQLAAGELFTERSEARRQRDAGLGLLECLEMRFEHGGSL